LVRSPIAADVAFCELLGKNKVLCLPGTSVEMPGYFRISRTANGDMIVRSLPGFAQAFKEAVGEVLYN
jgi:aspartate aminotransferase